MNIELLNSLYASGLRWCGNVRYNTSVYYNVSKNYSNNVNKEE